MFFFNFFRSGKSSNTPSTSKYDDNDIAVRVGNNKIRFHPLEDRRRIRPLFVDDVYNIVAANKTVIVYAHYEENIFLYWSSLGTIIRTGQACEGAFYAQFETIDEDFLYFLITHGLGITSCLWFRLLPLDANIEQALAPEEHERVVDNWCAMNAPEESIAKIDNGDEKFGLIGDARFLVWTNPRLDLLDTIRKEATENGYRLVDGDYNL